MVLRRPKNCTSGDTASGFRTRCACAPMSGMVRGAVTYAGQALCSMSLTKFIHALVRCASSERRRDQVISLNKRGAPRSTLVFAT